MATIKITNLHPTGSELFHDSESYLNELTDDELNLPGGGTPGIVTTLAIRSGYKCAEVSIRVTVATYNFGRNQKWW
ncbi:MULTISPECIES: hypothetical protein [Cyanophyceae]|uniref:hypothetical protein n=1 Tax=Cyanophyceae TaxID=3028117 RepID=UPI001684CB44|nr:hypothetical protein [Trichocoleus sp. FACHB-40]MBD2002731.1 hypothetical protein [Trichocoleus sp. FACHB-40]